MTIICGVLFAGGGGTESGLIAAGRRVAWRIEVDSVIAAVNALNFGKDGMIVGPVEGVNPTKLEPIDELWASPPCQGASVARNKNLPKRDDDEVGIHILGYVKALEPQVVVIENVPPYQHRPVFKAIVAGLFDEGYLVRWSIENSADYGVPQTRRRLILRAVRNGLVPTLPGPVPWVGWYAAIEDLIPTLPESRFAPWQLARLKDIGESFLAGQQYDRPNTEPERSVQISRPLDPAMVVTASLGSKGKFPAAFLVHGADMRTMPVVSESVPSFTVMAGSGNANYPRAFLVDGENAGKEGPIYRDEGSNPAKTVTQSAASLAFLVDGKPENYAGDLQVLGGDDPCNTISAHKTKHMKRAFILDCRNTRTTTNEPFTMRLTDDPCFTVTDADAPRHKAFVAGDTAPSLLDIGEGRPSGFEWLDRGHVVRMTTRALARFQSIPDSYQLSGHVATDCRIIGNAVPCKLAEVIARSNDQVFGE